MTFGKDQLKEALTLLGTLADGEGKTLEISVYGSSVLMPQFDWRQATRDVDAVFEADKSDTSYGDPEGRAATIRDRAALMGGVFFAGGLGSLKARLIVESPSAFRRRLIFVSHDGLHRPRMVQPPA